MATHRLQFDMDKEAFEQMEELLKESHLPTRGDLIRHSLAWLHYTMRQIENGETLLIDREGKLHAVSFPFWRKR